jgi:hypothetical protein
VHESGAVGLLGGVLIVGAAAEPQVLKGRLAAPRDFQDVIELETISLGAPAPVFTFVRALPTVPLVHGALHVLGDVARVLGRLAAGASRAIRRPELLLLFLLHQSPESFQKQDVQVT